MYWACATSTSALFGWRELVLHQDVYIEETDDEHVETRSSFEPSGTLEPVVVSQ